MARPKKKPEYDSDQMAQQLMETVTDAYLNPLQGTEDDTGHPVTERQYRIYRKAVRIRNRY